MDSKKGIMHLIFLLFLWMNFPAVEGSTPPGVRRSGGRGPPPKRKWTRKYYILLVFIASSVLYFKELFRLQRVVHPLVEWGGGGGGRLSASGRWNIIFY